jgi:hypothetical protein
VYSGWGGHFNAINAATAITAYARLRHSREADTQLLPSLLRCWLQQLPYAGARQCANVLFALGQVGTGLGLDKLWEPTFEAYLGHVQHDMQLESCNPQGLANVFWACARLRKQPTSGQMAMMMQAVLLPEVLEAVHPQMLSDIFWALGKLCRLQSWQGDVSEADI